jgi:PAS domain S-box-containing protein
MKITLIAPLVGIMVIAHEILNSTDYDWKGEAEVELEVVLGDLDSGVQQAYLAVERGTDVIISRGGTASMIAKNVDIPVVEIQVTAFDILRALKRGGNISGTVGVVFARRFLFECEKLGALIGVPMREVFIENGIIAEHEIHSIVKENINIFIADAASEKVLLRQGLTVFPIESGKDSILKALAEAINIAAIRRKEQEKAELFRTIIDSLGEGIIAIDKSGRVNIFNPIAERIFQKPNSSVMGKYIGDSIPDDKLRCCLTDKFESEGVKNVGGRVVAIKRIPIKYNGEIVGAIANIQDVTQLQQFEQVVRQKLNMKGLVAKTCLEQLIGSSQVMEAVKERVRQYACTDTTVLITGESGTGKERIAQSIHNLSGRKQGPFVAVNCAALPENLLESEFFGYEQGAFTGAKKGGKVGLFELAHGGTIFLDEIGEIPLVLQARLLRVLQEREVMRLGSDKIVPIDVRVLAATNQELIKLVEKKEFRADLYYRLDVLRLHIPPLRERIEDILELAKFFLNKFADLNSRTLQFTKGAISLMEKYPWYGNIRQLENMIERVTLLTKGSLIEEKDVAKELDDCECWLKNSCCSEIESLELVEKEKITEILLQEKYNYTRAAKKLGISRTTLWRKIREWEKLH